MGACAECRVWIRRHMARDEVVAFVDTQGWQRHRGVHLLLEVLRLSTLLKQPLRIVYLITPKKIILKQFEIQSNVERGYLALWQRNCVHGLRISPASEF